MTSGRLDENGGSDAPIESRPRDLDVDLAVESLRHPDRFPLVSRGMSATPLSPRTLTAVSPAGNVLLLGIFVHDLRFARRYPWTHWLGIGLGLWNACLSLGVWLWFLFFPYLGT